MQGDWFEISRLLGEEEKTMKMGVGLVIIYMMMQFGPWVLLCLGIMGLVLIFCKKKSSPPGSKDPWICNIMYHFMGVCECYNLYYQV